MKRFHLVFVFVFCVVFSLTSLAPVFAQENAVKTKSIKAEVENRRIPDSARPNLKAEFENQSIDAPDDLRFPKAEWLTQWEFLNVDLSEAPTGFASAETVDHPFWNDALFGHYNLSDFCYTYGGGRTAVDDPYDEALEKSIELGFAAAERYFTDEGFPAILEMDRMFSNAEFTGLAPVFCKAGNLPVLEGIDHQAFGSTESNYFQIESSFVENARERDWFLAAAQNLSRAELGHSARRAGATPNAFNPHYWVGRDGIADALAIRSVEKIFGEEFGDYANLQDRYSFLPFRADAPLYKNVNENNKNINASAFWWFIAEHYLEKDSDLMDAFEAGVKSNNAMAAIDEYLDSIDGELSHGLETIYPQFVAHYLNWPRARFNGAISEEDWLSEVIGECERLTVNEIEPLAAKVIEIDEYASKCLEFEVDRAEDAWFGAATISIVAPDDKSDNLFTTVSKSVWPGIEGQTQDEYMCSDIFKAQDKGTECFLIPEQGRDPGTGQLYRFVHIDGIERIDGVIPGYIRVVLSYVPTEHKPYTANEADDRKISVGLTLSADVTVLDSNVFAAGPADTDYGSKRGVVPVGPMADRQITDVSDTTALSIFEGDAVGIDPALYQSALQGSTGPIGVNDSDGNGFSIILPNHIVPGNGVMGSVEVIPLFGIEGQFSIPNPDAKQSITIHRNDKDSFHFSSDFSLCMMSQTELIAKAMVEKTPDICKHGGVHKVAADIAIPHPKTFNPQTALRNERTENYMNLRLMRQDRIKSAFRGKGMGGAVSSSSSKNAGVNMSGIGEGADLGGLCSVIQSTGNCDCSCSAKTCLTEKRSSNSASSSDLACRLTCGKKWKACSP